MIVDAIASGFLGVVQAVVDATCPVSSVSIPDLTGFVHWYTWLNTFLPLSEALSAWALLMVLYGIVFSLRTVIMGVNVVRGSGA